MCRRPSETLLRYLFYSTVDPLGSTKEKHNKANSGVDGGSGEPDAHREARLTDPSRLLSEVCCDTMTGYVGK